MANGAVEDVEKKESKKLPFALPAGYALASQIKLRTQTLYN